MKKKDIMASHKQMVSWILFHVAFADTWVSQPGYDRQHAAEAVRPHRGANSHQGSLPASVVLYGLAQKSIYNQMYQN